MVAVRSLGIHQTGSEFAVCLECILKIRMDKGKQYLSVSVYDIASFRGTNSVGYPHRWVLSSLSLKLSFPCSRLFPYCTNFDIYPRLQASKSEVAFEVTYYIRFGTKSDVKIRVSFRANVGVSGSGSKSCHFLGQRLEPRQSRTIRRL